MPVLTPLQPENQYAADRVHQQIDDVVAAVLEMEENELDSRELKQIAFHSLLYFAWPAGNA